MDLQLMLVFTLGAALGAALAGPALWWRSLVRERQRLPMLRCSVCAQAASCRGLDLSETPCSVEGVTLQRG
jgi:hypothetical protein